jgi:hypothetical protein
MVINQNLSPQQNVYYLGALVISVLKRKNDAGVDLLELHSELNKSGKHSINSVVLAVDWLYLVGYLKKNSKGKIERCT